MLLQLGRELHRRGDRFWLTVGGGRERGETLAQAAAREMREEAGIVVDPAALGAPIAESVLRYAAFGLLPVVQYQTYFAVAVDGAAVSTAGQSLPERLTIERHEWLSAEELLLRPERLADAELPRLIAVAVAAVRG